MIYIAHRGNLDGPNPEKENHPDYIAKATAAGYAAEVDVWYEQDKWMLGHDNPTYDVSDSFFDNKLLWCHAKNLAALQQLSNLRVHYFWHQEDDVVLTSRGFFWTYPGKELAPKSIAVMPEIAVHSTAAQCGGICSDYIEKYACGERKLL